MKVICIDSKGMSPEVPPINEGSIYTVIDKATGPITGYEYYIFSEMGEDNCYLASRFAPLSDIDELELAEQRLVTA